jgi:glycosyltransferase involved in cell wall biosynthesis
MSLSVVFVLWTGGIGGAERHTAALCRAMYRLGDRAEVVVVGDANPFASTLAKGVAVRELGLRRGRDILFHSGLLTEAVAEFDVCVLPANGYLAPLAAGASSVLVAMEHGDALNAPTLLSARRRLADRATRSFGARFLACEIAVSQVAASVLAGMPHAPRIETIHNGLEVDPPCVVGRSGDRPLTVGSVGRLVEGKGVELLIAAAATLKEEDRRIAVRVGGDGPQRASLEALAVSRGVSDRVEFVGWVDDVAAFWSECDAGVFVTSGLSESFGLALFEALAAGVTVVTAASPVQAELLAGAPGVVLTTDRSGESIAATLSDVLDGGPPAAVQREERYEWVASNYGVDACARRYHQLFELLVAHAREAVAEVEAPWKV